MNGLRDVLDVGDRGFDAVSATLHLGGEPRHLVAEVRVRVGQRDVQHRRRHGGQNEIYSEKCPVEV